jgi:hypothetical protein
MTVTGVSTKSKILPRVTETEKCRIQEVRRRERWEMATQGHFVCPASTNASIAFREDIIKGEKILGQKLKIDEAASVDFHAAHGCMYNE